MKSDGFIKKKTKTIVHVWCLNQEKYSSSVYLFDVDLDLKFDTRDPLWTNYSRLVNFITCKLKT